MISDSIGNLYLISRLSHLTEWKKIKIERINSDKLDQNLKIKNAIQKYGN